MANNVDPDHQTLGAIDMGLHCLINLPDLIHRHLKGLIALSVTNVLSWTSHFCFVIVHGPD